MECYSHLCTNHYKLRPIKIEIDSIKTLTNKVLSKIENFSEVDYCEKRWNTSDSTTLPQLTDVDETEELYRIMNLFLRGLVHHLNSKSDSHALHVTVRSPMYCRLPSVCAMLWKHVEAVCKKTHKGNKADCPLSNEVIAVTMSSKCIQTDNSCLTYCESCHLSTDLIKRLVHTVLAEQERYSINETRVSAFRKKIINEVFELSQWGSMEGWVVAIQKDMRWATGVMAVSQRRYKELSQTRAAERREYNKIVAALKSSLEEFMALLEAEKSQNTYLKHQVEELNSSLSRSTKYASSLEKQICGFKRRLEYMKDSVQLYLKETFTQLRENYKVHSTYIKCMLFTESRNILFMKNEIALSFKCLEKCHNEIIRNMQLKERETLNILIQKENVINELKIKQTTLELEKQDLKEQVLVLNATVQQDKEMIIIVTKLEEKVFELEKKLKDSKAKCLLYKSRLESTNHACISFSGDPMRDIERQREVNKQKIRALLKENEGLKATLYKIKAVGSSRISTPSSVFNSD